MNIIYYLSSNKEEEKEKYYEKVKKIAKYFTQCVYSQKLRKLDISLKDIKEKSREPDKSQKEKKSESNEKDIYQKYIKDKSRESDNIQKDTYNLKGIYKCNIYKFNVDQFIIKIFLELTGTFPIAQNILLTNNETSTEEIYSFIYRAIKCRFNSLFVISISDDFSIKNLNIMTNLINQIISDMK